MDTYAYTGAATVKASSLNVRSGAGTGYQAIGRLAAGASIQVLGEQRGTDGKTWYQIRFSGTGGTEQTGYVSPVLFFIKDCVKNPFYGIFFIIMTNIALCQLQRKNFT